MKPILPHDAPASTPVSVRLPHSIIIDQRLSAIDFRLYSLILCEDSPIDAQHITSATAASSLGCTERGARKILARLHRLGFLTRRVPLSSAAARDLLQSKQPACLPTHPFSFPRCAWCGGETAFLHEHHHAIPKAAGGTETVEICPNCHVEYHFFTRETYAVVDVEAPK